MARLMQSCLCLCTLDYTPLSQEARLIVVAIISVRKV